MSPEYSLQTFAVQLLTLSHAPGVVFFHVPNQRSTGPRTGAFLKKMGVRAGVSDLVVLVPGKPTGFLEMKAGSGHLTAPQRHFRQDVEAAGCRYAVASSSDSIADVLHQWDAVK